MAVTFQIISDGSCDLSREQLRAAELEVVPYYISLDGENYQKEMTELNVREFYEFCVSHPGVFPKTSMPTVQDYLDAFEKHLRRGADVLRYCLTEKFSGSFSCACTAAAMLMEDYPDRRIRVVDSTLATGPHGLLLLELAKFKKEGHSLDETYERGEKIKRSHFLSSSKHFSWNSSVRFQTLSRFRSEPPSAYTRDRIRWAFALSRKRKTSLQKILFMCLLGSVSVIGIIVGLVGIVLLLGLIPICRGLK